MSSQLYVIKRKVSSHLGLLEMSYPLGLTLRLRETNRDVLRDGKGSKVAFIACMTHKDLSVTFFVRKFTSSSLVRVEIRGNRILVETAMERDLEHWCEFTQVFRDRRFVLDPIERLGFVAAALPALHDTLGVDTFDFGPLSMETTIFSESLCEAPLNTPCPVGLLQREGRIFVLKNCDRCPTTESKTRG